jgi:hypothetical protein
MFLGILVGIICMGGMIYLALNKNSTFIVRLASLGAFAVMILTLVICVITYVTGGSAPVDWSTYIVTDEIPEPVKEDHTGLTAVIITIVFFLALFIVILALAMKEHKKNTVVKETGAI